VVAKILGTMATFMLCMECGAEMRLVQVAKANTIPVSGFEHRTWQCSGCSAVEQRMTFTREKTRAKTEPVDPTRTVLVAPIQTSKTAPAKSALAEPTKQVQSDQAKPAQTTALQLTQAAPAEPTKTVVLEKSRTAPKNDAVQAKPAEQVQRDGTQPTEMVSVEPVLTARVEPLETVRLAKPEAPTVVTQIEARAKALEEKVRNLKERVTAAKKVAGDTRRDARFNRNWDNEFRSVPPPSEPSKASSHIRPDEPVLSSAKPIASPAPISDEGPGAPLTPAPTQRRKKLGELVRAIAPKGFSKFANFGSVSGSR
jgi:hypothetical protein